MNSLVEKWEKKTEPWLLGLSILFLLVLWLPLVHELTPEIRSVLNFADWAIWAIFAINYYILIKLSDQRWLFVRTHLFELLIVLLPLLRPLKFLRLIPIIGYFLHYTRRSMAGRLLQFAAVALVLISVPAAGLVYEIESRQADANIKSIGDAFWWVIVTITTIGYGDTFPVTGIGRVVAVIVILTGVGAVGVLTASVAAWFVRSDEMKTEDVQLKEILIRLERIEKS